jgi:hypothetical protein
MLIASDHAGSAAGSEPSRQDAPRLLVCIAIAFATFGSKRPPEFDAVPAERFRPDYDRAAAGAYEPWEDGPQTCLALILLLDHVFVERVRAS